MDTNLKSNNHNRVYFVPLGWSHLFYLSVVESVVLLIGAEVDTTFACSLTTKENNTLNGIYHL